MNTSVITIKVQPQVKKRAQSIAQQLGLSLSSVIKGYLNQLIKTKTVTFSAAKEEPTDYLLQALKGSKDDIKSGRISPPFDNADEAVAWLNNPKRKYAH